MRGNHFIIDDVSNAVEMYKIGLIDSEKVYRSNKGVYRCNSRDNRGVTDVTRMYREGTIS